VFIRRSGEEEFGKRGENELGDLHATEKKEEKITEGSRKSVASP